jgi:serine/threonine protein phosphatase PrpC
MWVLNSVSNIGKRKSNQDFIIHQTFKKHKRHIDVLIVCDGIGEFKSSHLCSELISKMALGKISSAIKNRKSRKVLEKSDVGHFQNLLQNLKITGIDENAGTTFTATIIDRKNNKKGVSILFFWAGDSRIYMKEGKNKIEQLSYDHINEKDPDKPITSSYNEKGEILGVLECGFRSISNLSYIALSTDGIHDKCKPSELETFFDYCNSLGKITNEQLEDDLTYFLDKNITDNFSLLILRNKS